MLVRIKLPRHPSKGRERQYPPQHQAIALALASLLTPSSLLAFTMAFWRIAADLRWTHEFFISEGILSHWQTWLAAAAILLAAASVLNRWGHAANIEMLPQSATPLQKIGTHSAE